MPESTMSVRDSLKFQNKCFPKDNSLKDSNLLSLRGNLQGKGYIYIVCNICKERSLLGALKYCNSFSKCGGERIFINFCITL